MSQQELLSFVIERFCSLGIEAMLSGSHASSVQGEARATHDIDLVVDMSESQIPAFVAAFSEDRF
jgi:predicted nucleotidyltransferase